MDNLVVLGASILVIFLLIMLLYLINTKTSNTIKLEGNLLTINYPLKKEVIDMERDLVEWNLQQVNYLRWRRINSINLKLNSGKWRRIYYRFNSERFQNLLSYLNERKKSIEHPID